MEKPGLFTVNEQLLQVIEETPKLSKQQEQALLKETSKLSISFIRQACKQVAERSITHLVHGVQYLLFWLLEKIHEKQVHNHTNFREKIAEQLCSFLGFLQNNSSGWFNIDTPMPHYLWLPIHETIHVYLQKGRSFVLEQTEEELVQIMQEVYSLTTEKRTPTYRVAAYWQKLTSSLQLNAEHPENDHTKTVYTLLRYNFNHSLFVQYVFRCYMQAITTPESTKTHWQHAFQHINRIIPESGLKLLTDEEDCTAHLLKMISNEMNAELFSKDAEHLLQKHIPYQYNLSVAQLAVAFRIQIEAGIIQTNNVREMLRYFADHCVTRRADTIGIKSLYNNYHQPERAALKIMLEYNNRMRNVLISLLDG